MKNYKIFVPTEEGSRKVQIKAFRLGYSRSLFREIVIRLDAPFLYVYDDGSMGYGNDISDFTDNANSLISVNDFLALPEPEPEAPSHDEIMRPRWWQMSNGEWETMQLYRFGIYEFKTFSLNRYGFVGLKSADIPPEGEG